MRASLNGLLPIGISCSLTAPHPPRRLSTKLAGAARHSNRKILARINQFHPKGSAGDLAGDRMRESNRANTGAGLLKPALSKNKPSVAVIILLAAALIFPDATSIVRAFADARTGEQAARELTIIASFADKQVTADEPIELRLSRALTRSQEILAVIIGQSDVTSLFTVADKRLRYNPKVVALPFGESAVTVYLVSPENNWKELARFTLRVGKERLEATPREESDKEDEREHQAGKSSEVQSNNLSLLRSEPPASPTRESTPESKAQGDRREQTSDTQQATARRNKRGLVLNRRRRGRNRRRTKERRCEPSCPSN